MNFFWLIPEYFLTLKGAAYVLVLIRMTRHLLGSLLEAFEWCSNVWGLFEVCGVP